MSRWGVTARWWRAMPVWSMTVSVSPVSMMSMSTTTSSSKVHSFVMATDARRDTRHDHDDDENEDNDIDPVHGCRLSLLSIESWKIVWLLFLLLFVFVR